MKKVGKMLQVSEKVCTFVDEIRNKGVDVGKAC